ncbi:MAG: winged helix-turn-helix domain-containing protein [Candidatus Eremiobacteraeota bacterium]|nr:winged helix-turn-helix domain-containing protein [Candidatus Eremiobacteraeota bacterium]
MMEQRAQIGVVYRFGPFALDADRLLLEVDGRPVSIGPKVVETLLVLVASAGTVLTKDQMLERIWPEGFVEEANLAQNIYVLRKTLRAHRLEPAIETLPRRGYRFVAEVRVDAEAPPVRKLRVVTAPPRKARRWPVFLAAACVALFFVFAESRPQFAAHATLSPEATRLYAMGRYYWNLRTPDGLQKSVTYFDDVVRMAPHNPLGYSGLADAYSMIVDYRCLSYDRHTCGAQEKAARRNAAQALRLDRDSAAAHTSYAMILQMFDKNVAKSDAEFERAIALDPRYALAHEWYGTLLLMRGENARARKELEIAISLEPIATATNADLAEDAYFDHRFADAVKYSRETLSLNPNRVDALPIFGLSLEQSGDPKGALAIFRRMERVCGCPGQTEVYVAGVYARMGQRAQALAALRRAKHEAKMLSPDEVAFVYIAMGDREDALAYMKRIHWKDHVERQFLALDPRMDPVRHDPRFRAWTNAG